MSKIKVYRLLLLIFAAIIAVVLVIESISEYKFYLFRLDGRRVIYVCLIAMSLIIIIMCVLAIYKNKSYAKRFLIVIAIIILLCIITIFCFLLAYGTYYNYSSPDNKHNIVILQEPLFRDSVCTVYERVHLVLLKRIDEFYIEQTRPIDIMEFKWGNNYVDIYYFDYGTDKCIRVELYGG